MTNRKDSNGNIPGGQVKYFNEYYYGNGLVALNTMKATPHFLLYLQLFQTFYLIQLIHYSFNLDKLQRNTLITRY
ncbi:MAG: hypothetical protein ACOC1O_03930 [bacterium]